MHKVLKLFNNFKLLLLYYYGYIINNPNFNITLTSNYAFTILYFEPIFNIMLRNLISFSVIIKINVDLAAILRSGNHRPQFFIPMSMALSKKLQ